MKRLSVYGQSRGRATTMLADVWANLTTLARLIREANLVQPHLNRFLRLHFSLIWPRPTWSNSPCLFQAMPPCFYVPDLPFLPYSHSICFAYPNSRRALVLEALEQP